MAKHRFRTHVQLFAEEQSKFNQKSGGHQSAGKVGEQSVQLLLNSWRHFSRLHPWGNHASRGVSQVPQNVTSVLVVPAPHLPEQRNGTTSDPAILTKSLKHYVPVRIELLADEVSDVPGGLVRGGVEQDVTLTKAFHDHNSRHRPNLEHL